MTTNWIEYIGYIASAFVMGSFLINNNIRLLRIINLMGAVLFFIYGVLIQKIPVLLPNVGIICIQLYYLFFTSKKA